VRLASHPLSLFLFPLKVSGVGALGRATGYGASSAGAGLSAAIVLLLEGSGVSELSDPSGDCPSGVVGLAVRDSLSACCNASPSRDMSMFEVAVVVRGVLLRDATKCYGSLDIGVQQVANLVSSNKG
jgi:hypothetical protein